MVVNNKVQVIYRLSDRVTFMWPVRPNASNGTRPELYILYWDATKSGGYANVLGQVENSTNYQPEAFGIRSYYQKVVLNVTPSLIPGWNNNVSNYVKLVPVIGGVPQTAEGPVTVPPYTTTESMMRLHYPELEPKAIIGWNSDQGRFIPVAVDGTGKLVTTV